MKINKLLKSLSFPCKPNKKEDNLVLPLPSVKMSPLPFSPPNQTYYLIKIPIFHSFKMLEFQVSVYLTLSRNES